MGHSVLGPGGGLRPEVPDQHRLPFVERMHTGTSSVHARKELPEIA